MDSEIQKLLKEILPQLEQQLRRQLKKEYEIKLKQIQKYYQQQVDTIIKKKEQELRQLYDTKLKQQNNDIFKKIGSLQAQRKDWLQMQLSYQKTIKQLTDKVLNLDKKLVQKQENQQQMKNNSQSDSLNDSFQKSQIMKQMSGIITPQPPQLSKDLTQKVSKWKKKDKKDNNNQLNKYFDMPKKVELKYAENYEYQNIRQYQQTSIMGPPVCQNEQIKNEQIKKPIKKNKNVFWNEEKKKQLLQMIKLK